MRFYAKTQNALHHKMPLQPPKKNPELGGYFLAMAPPVQAPRLTCDASGWTLTDDWVTWATEQRKQLLGELVSHGNWFSRPPRRDVIEPLFAPWTGKNMQGVQQIFCKQPATPGAGAATWSLEGLVMSASAIAPVWAVQEFAPRDESDRISLFDADDGDTVDEGYETREIQFEDIELASPAAAPTQMRNREWEAKKFLAKERVREYRLKAQLADHMAAKEESRFYKLFGDLDDGESRFSEYDLTEDEGSVSDTPSQA
jgi:hypothetical protein